MLLEVAFVQAPQINSPVTRERDLAKVDSLLAEIDAFADAASGHGSYPIPTREMVDVVAAFEAIIQSMGTGRPVSIERLPT